MATKIVTKNSSTASAVPTASDLVQGELAVNVADKRLFTEDNGGAIVELGTNPSTLTVAGEITANGGIALGDSDKATFGAGDDLQIYHDGNNSYIDESATGSLLIRGSNLQLRSYGTNEYFFTGVENGASTIYYDGLNKLATTSTGIDVTGTATMDGLVVDGTNIQINGSNPYLDFNDTTNANTFRIQNVDSTVRYFADRDNQFGNSKHEFIVDGNKIVAQFKSGGDISFYEDTGTTPKLFWDASAESLGIGTSSPDSLLTIDKDVSTAYSSTDDGGQRSNTNTLLLKNEDGTANSFAQIAFDLAGSNQSIARIVGINDGTSTSALAFVTEGNNVKREVMRLDGAGNVGIGTSSPVTDLDVRNNISMGDGTSVTNLSMTRNSANYISASHASGYLALRTGGSVERMRIDSSGNVGIGTSSPSSQYFNNLVVGNDAAGDKGITIRSNASNRGVLAFSDTDSATDGRYSGFISYDHSDNAMKLHTNGGNERMRIDSSGNLLVGKTAADFGVDGVALQPSGVVGITRDGGAPLIVNRKTSDGDMVICQKDGTVVGSIGSVTQSGATNLVLDSTSAVYFDTNLRPKTDNTYDVGSGTYRFKDLYLSGAANVGGNIVSSANNFIYSHNGGASGTVRSGFKLEGSSNTLAFYTDATERARIDSSGNLLVGCTGQTDDAPNVDGSFKAGGGNFKIRKGTNGWQWFQFYGTGTTSPIGSISNNNNTAVIYATSSDQRLKENIADADDAGSKIDSIQVRKYDWKADGSHQDYGMIAQELQAVAPEAVSVPEDSEEMMGVDYSKLVPMLIKEIQSLRNRVAQLEE